MSKLQEPAFATERMSVWALRLKPTPQHEPRLVLVAIRTDIDCPMAIASMTLWLNMGYIAGGPIGSHHVEMIEVNEQHRREGLARELWLGVQKAYGPLIGDAITPEGDALLASIDRHATRPEPRHGQ